METYEHSYNMRGARPKLSLIVSEERRLTEASYARGLAELRAADCKGLDN